MAFKITHFRVRDEQGQPLLGTTVRVDAQDGRTFSIGSNINDGGGVGELGAGFSGPDGILSVTNYTAKYTTPTLPLARVAASPTGEMGVSLIDGPSGPASFLEIVLPFVS